MSARGRVLSGTSIFCLPARYWPVKLRGDLAIASAVPVATTSPPRRAATLLRERFGDTVIESSVALVIVDLRGLEFMDSTGLSTLVKAHQRADEAGQRFVLTRGPQQVQRLLSLTGVAERLELADTPEELLAAE